MPKFALRSTRILVRSAVVAAATGLALAIPQASASAADTKYASIAISTSTGATGKSWNYPSATEATAAAIDACNEGALTSARHRAAAPAMAKHHGGK
ncbi:DUF4189 domain-containing protein [Nocardia lijiangensis]|uniref:DUF4189 domain-containing protein n=1 Tax=Nocardia lijiangensis TaxID=299618 RepID=UPI000833A4FD|nr:DUF4189 domain-containing protein [Nocardia lijiangensis]